MTELKKPDINDSLWHSEDIRSVNLALNIRVDKDIRENNQLFQWRTLIDSLQFLALIFLDTLMLCVSWTLANKLNRPQPGIHLSESMIPILAISVGTLAASGFYGTDDKIRRFTKLFVSLTLSQIVILITAIFYQPGIWISNSFLLFSWMSNFLFIGGARFFIALLSRQLRKHNPVVLIGNQIDIEHVLKILQRSRQFRVSRIIDLSKWDMKSQFEQILDQIRACKVNEVFICSQQSIDNQIILLWHLKAFGIHLRIIPNEQQLPQQIAEIKMIGEVPTLRFNSSPVSGINFWLKRLFDWSTALAILILISPFFLLISISIKISSPGPIFYKQRRVGLKGRQFQVWKFRTMVANASELQKELETQNEVKGGVLFKIKEDPRITKIGKLLRGYSIDELPQLINVLQGQMSLVGPRPLSVRDYEFSLQNLEHFSEDRFLRYEVLPGITGLWQVKGRVHNNSDEIFYWDMIYVLQWSLTLDLKILIETIKVVLLKEGAY